MLQNPIRAGWCLLGKKQCWMLSEWKKALICGQHKIRGTSKTLNSEFGTNKIEKMDYCPLEGP